LISKEWKGVSTKTRTMLFVGVATVIAAVGVVGFGNYLKEKQEKEQKEKIGQEQTYKMNVLPLNFNLNKSYGYLKP